MRKNEIKSTYKKERTTLRKKTDYGKCRQGNIRTNGYKQ